MVSSRLGGDDGDAAKWGLHFDLTVPFARYVLENSGKLAFPFRRYQIQKAWRGERPQEGRYREFTQADIDVVDVGELSPHFEAEMPLVIADVFSRFPVGDFVIQVNNRKIPNGFYQGIGLSDVTSTLRIADKLDKLGAEKVADLVESGATREQAEQCLALAPFARRISASWSVCVSSASRTRCSKGLESLRGHPHRDGPRAGQGRRGPAHRSWPRLLHGHRLRDPDHRQRGLGLGLPGGHDALASDGRNTYPGVEISIGVSRILGLLIGQGLVTASRSTPAAVLVALTDDESREESVAVATALRSRGSRVKWPRRRRASASRSATPSAAGSPSSGSPGQGSRATR